MNKEIHEYVESIAKKLSEKAMKFYEDNDPNAHYLYLVASAFSNVSAMIFDFDDVEKRDELRDYFLIYFGIEDDD